jgi:type VI secretion system protein VasG
MRMHESGATPTAEEMIARVRPTLSKHFKPALLARMTIVPYAPVGTHIMREIVAMKLDKVVGRLRAAHGVETTLAPELLDNLARRCTEAETGARNAEHILQGSLMPALSRELLQRLAAGPLPRQLNIALSPEGDWDIRFAEA